MLIALYERAVGLYASLVDVNAYHQPGVEAGKKAAVGILELQKSVINFLDSNYGSSFNVEAIAEGINQSDQAELIYKVLEHIAANPSRGIEQIGFGVESKFGLT